VYYTNIDPYNASRQTLREIYAIKKEENEAMAARLERMGLIKRSERLQKCSDIVIMNTCSQCDIRYIGRASCCRDRFCPICAWRRGLSLGSEIHKTMSDNLKISGQKMPRVMFVTLTLENVSSNELKETIIKMMDAWSKLTRRVVWENVSGYVRALDVSIGKGETLHPHFHVLIIGTAAINAHNLAENWRDCLGINYQPVVNVREIKAGEELKKISQYISKPFDLGALNDDDFANCVQALDGVRLIAFGGCLGKRNSKPGIEKQNAEGKEHKKCKECGGRLEERRFAWDAKRKGYFELRAGMLARMLQKLGRWFGRLKGALCKWLN